MHRYLYFSFYSFRIVTCLCPRDIILLLAFHQKYSIRFKYSK